VPILQNYFYETSVSTMYTLTLRYLHYFNIRINNRYLFLP